MIFSSTHTISGPTLIAVGQPHCVYLDTDDTGIVVGGADDQTFPIFDTNVSPVRIELSYEGEELWADGTGDIHLLEVGLGSTPDIS